MAYVIQNLWTGKIVTGADGTAIGHRTREEAEAEIEKFAELGGNVPYAPLAVDGPAAYSEREIVNACLDLGQNQ